MGLAARHDGGKSGVNIELWPIDRVAPYERNPRRNQAAVAKVAASIRAFGFRQPIVVDDVGVIIVGHTRWLAARELALGEVPVHVATGLTPEQVRAYRLADNRTHEDSSWDDALLAAELTALDALGFDLSVTGFEDAELERLVAHLGDALADATDDTVRPVPANPVTRPGDLWRLGEHRVVCGDATDPAVAARATDGDPIACLVTSPPYNVGVRYASYDDREVEREDYLAFLEAALRAWTPQMVPGGVVAWNCGVSPKTWPHYHALSLERAGLTFLRQLVWVKSGVPVPTFHVTRDNPRARAYHPNWRHELIYLFARGLRPVASDVAIVLPDVGEDDVWDFIHQSSATRDLPDAASGAPHHSALELRATKVHPATFPVQLPLTLLAYLSAPGELVADPFGGAGAVLIAAERLGRRAALTEIDPGYCDVIVRRWEGATGRTAERVSSGVGPGRSVAAHALEAGK